MGAVMAPFGFLYFLRRKMKYKDLTSILIAKLITIPFIEKKEHGNNNTFWLTISALFLTNLSAFLFCYSGLYFESIAMECFGVFFYSIIIKRNWMEAKDDRDIEIMEKIINLLNEEAKKNRKGGD